MVELFCSCLPGLERMLADEVAALGGKARVEAGGVAFEADPSLLYRANLELGLCAHVLARVGAFHVRSLGELVRKTMGLPWRRFLRQDIAVEVRATCRRSRLYHSGAVAQRVEEGIAAALGGMPLAGMSERSVKVVARLFGDTCSLSIDTSGEPLHQRGWRSQGSAAPLRADLARALILASGWDRRSPLLDPMAGSGTIAIEAACLARNLAPGRLREFGFLATSLLEPETWERVRNAALQRAAPRTPAPILVRDRSLAAIEATVANAAAAGVEQDLEIEQAPFSQAPYLSDAAVEPPAAGALVVNPPFGRRLVTRGGLVELYQSLGRHAARLPSSWRIALLAADRRLALRTGLPLRTAFLADHGGLKVRALVRA